MHHRVCYKPNRYLMIIIKVKTSHFYYIHKTKILIHYYIQCMSHLRKMCFKSLNMNESKLKNKTFFAWLDVLTAQYLSVFGSIYYLHAMLYFNMTLGRHNIMSTLYFVNRLRSVPIIYCCLGFYFPYKLFEFVISYNIVTRIFVHEFVQFFDNGLTRKFN